jgi:hypothetical protein
VQRRRHGNEADLRPIIGIWNPVEGFEDGTSGHSDHTCAITKMIQPFADLLKWGKRLTRLHGVVRYIYDENVHWRLRCSDLPSSETSTGC